MTNLLDTYFDACLPGEMSSGSFAWSATKSSTVTLCAVGYTLIHYTPAWAPKQPSRLAYFLPPLRLQRMKLEDFIRNLRGIDNNRDLDEEMLTGIYERIRNQEFRPGTNYIKSAGPGSSSSNTNLLSCICVEKAWKVLRVPVTCKSARVLATLSALRILKLDRYVRSFKW